MEIMPKIEGENSNRSYYIVKKRGCENIHEDDYESSYTEARRKGIKLTREKYSPETKVIVAKFAKNHIARLAADRYSIPVGTIRRWLSKYNRLGSAAFLLDGEPVPQDNKFTLKTQILAPPKKEKQVTMTPENRGNVCKSEDNEVKEEKEIKGEVEDMKDLGDSDLKGTLTTSHIRLNRRNPKLPNVEGWEKVNLISPSLRLWAAQEGMKKGCNSTAALVGVSNETLKKWMMAYQYMGKEAHIFKTNVKYYSGPDNAGRGEGVVLFSLQFKKDIIDKSLVQGRCKVAFENGISPDTISRWKSKLKYPNKQSEDNVPLPSWYKKPKKKKSTAGYPVAERCAGGKWEFVEPFNERNQPINLSAARVPVVDPSNDVVDGIYLD